MNMEDENFVADSDEDEQEFLDALAQAEETIARQRLESAAAAQQQQTTDEHKEQEQKQYDIIVNESRTIRGQENAQEEKCIGMNEDRSKEIDDEHEDDKNEEKEKAQGVEQADDVLKVGTVVEVESRTWPGINKQGGAGRVTHVYRETLKEGEAEEIFYDVRYVLGGFERHIEREYVHSSKLLKKQSNREKVSREYYHDDYINEPHLRKQREAERKRKQLMTHPEQLQMHILRRKKRKPSHVPSRVEEMSDSRNEALSSSDDEGKGDSSTANDDAVVLTQNRRISQMISHRNIEQTARDALESPARQSGKTQRWRYRILDSSDEDSSRSGNTGDFSSSDTGQTDLLDSDSVYSLVAGGDAQSNRNNRHRHRRKKIINVKRRRFVGGYEHNEDDADGRFIQPEGNPDELPDDVIRVTGLRLETTRDGLMNQLNEVFVQQKNNIAAFHEKQKTMDQKIKTLSEMHLSDLLVLYREIVDLEENFLTKTLVNAGEDAMDMIARKLDHCGNLPASFEQLDRDIDDCREELKECSHWVHTVRDTLEDALSQRNALEPLQHVDLAEYSSDSSYSIDNNNTGNYLSGMTGGDEITDTEKIRKEEGINATKKQQQQRDSVSEIEARRLKAKSRSCRQRTARSTTLNDYFHQNESSNCLTSNLRLSGKQKKVVSSDPRWAWIKLARRKQQQAKKGIQNQPSWTSSVGLSGENFSVRTIRDVRSTRVISRDDSTFVQAQRMHFRNKRFSALPKQWRSRESFVAVSASPSGPTSTFAAYPAGISFNDTSFEKRLQPAKTVTVPSKSAVDWEGIFEVVMNDISDGENGNDTYEFTGQEVLWTFGHRVFDPMILAHLSFVDECDFKDLENIEDVVKRQTSRLRQRLNDLRFQENAFMELLSKGCLDISDEEKYAITPQWLTLVSLEEAYHKAIASLVAQLLQASKQLLNVNLPSCLPIIWEQITALVRQLPDCNALFNGCEAYLFFFEVASRDATTTPLLTAVLRTYWYCLDLLVALQSMLHIQHTQKIENVSLTALPVNRIILAVVLFLFDLHVHLPSSHRLDKRSDGMLIGSSPALSLWMLVRDCSMSSAEADKSDHDSLIAKEKHVWTLLQVVYRQRYWDRLAQYFVQSESCGGYLRDLEPSIADAKTRDACDEMFESQLLSLETAWKLVAILAQIYAVSDSDKHEEAVCDAKWAVVKELLQPDNPDFLPFNLPRNHEIFLQIDFCRGATTYKRHVLRRVMTFSRRWRSSKDIVVHLLRQLWGNDEPYQPGAVIQIPRLFKEYISQCRKLGNSKSRLAAFAEANDADGDSTTALCKIIWIQLLKLEKRVHRSRFRRAVLSAIPGDSSSRQVPEPANSVFTSQDSFKTPKTEWCWDTNDIPEKIVAVKPSKVSGQIPSMKSRLGNERTGIALLLVFAVVEVCSECGDEEYFSVKRHDKDVRYMEREVEFYCKEFLRWTSKKPEYDLLVAQALFTLGALLLEKNSSEFSTVFWALNDKLESSMNNMQGHSVGSSTPKQQLDQKASTLSTFQQERRGAAMASLYHMRDLIIKMLQMPSSGIGSGSAFGLAVLKSLEHVFGTGMEAFLNLATHQRFVAITDLKVALDIFQLLLPIASDEPKQCLTLSSSQGAYDDSFDDALAMLDMDVMLEKRNSGSTFTWTVMECRTKAIQLVTNNLRVAIQHLVLNYPTNGTPTFEELYSLDLLGLIIATCNVQFFWDNLTSTSAKSRNLAPRVLGAALKYTADKDWLRKVFLRESGAEQHLAIAWLLGTLDAATLKKKPLLFRLEEIPSSILKTNSQETMIQNQGCVNDSDYWLMLTDGIIYNLLRSDSWGVELMNSHVLKLLREVASICNFCTFIRADKASLDDSATLYDLHLDIFRAFCKAASNIWRSYASTFSNNWPEMNQFRTKMVHPSKGIFVSFLEAYKLNFRRACCEIDHWNHNWHKFAELFLRQAGVNVVQGLSYHEVDDSIKTFDERLTGLTTMFRFMYQCMDAFLFYCGEMAIGETNLFFSAMELLFRQVNCAEHPQAIKRLEDQRRRMGREGGRSINNDLRKGFCSSSMRFVDSVQLFFALQKYPSLLHWFAQTSEIYQTFENGWRFSPLRTLLVNSLDPDGPLGIHSYYPEDETSNDFDVQAVRREAFYLSCGVFSCRCTRSFEHSRDKPVAVTCKRLQHLRKFILNDFMRETLSFVIQSDASSLLETFAPLIQFMRAVLHHANLNTESVITIQENEPRAADDVNSFDFRLDELYPCLEWIVECMIKLVPGEEAVHNAICCVLLIELCGIMSEAIKFSDRRPMLELIDLVELVLSYLKTIYMALSKRTTAVIDTLFVSNLLRPLPVVLSTYRFSTSAFLDIAVDDNQILSREWEAYGVSLARATTDLLAAISRVVQYCKDSPDERLRSLTISLSS
ncbi:hypothetical protein Plhal304r1_c012g0046151 [Plasmopara halstedii]